MTLGVVWNGDSVSSADIRSTRPMAAHILKGKTQAQVAKLVPLLFSVCGKAQGAAADAALRAAQQGGATASAAVERVIACEAIQEHLWRLMLDWTKLMGLPRQEQRFAGWYALLRRVGMGEVGMDVFQREFERDCLHMSGAEWRALGNYQTLQTWSLKVHSPSAHVLSRLDELERGRHQAPDGRLLPAWTAAEAARACEGKWDAGFSARPDWLGETAETGAWAYYADDGLLHDVWRQSKSKVLSRLLARMTDVIAMAGGTAAPRLDATSPEDNTGVAVVRTARGLLMHYVRLEGELVADYVIVAPTEWNFHPDGAYARDMRGLDARDMERLRQWAHVAALSLDPCVAYEIEVPGHA